MIQRGPSQNPYVVEEGKMVLIDTVGAPYKSECPNNLARETDLSKEGAAVANHGGPDRPRGLPNCMARLPEGTPIYPEFPGDCI